MGIEIVRGARDGGAVWVADRDVYVVRDGSRLANPKDLEGRLLVAKGHRLPEIEAVRLGLVSAKDAGAAARAAFEADQVEQDKRRQSAERGEAEEKADEPAEDKGAAPAENKAKKMGKK